MQESAIENPYGLGALIANGDIIARSILLILLIMSLLTWFIMITKFFDQRRQRKQAIEAEKEFWSSSSLTDALGDRKSTRLNSSHQIISYAVFCLKKKKLVQRLLLLRR